MEFTLINSFGGEQAVTDAGHYPQLRLLTLLRHSALTAANDSTPRWNQSGWEVSAPQWVNGPNWGYFSAICWYMGRVIYDQINRGDQRRLIPIGLIDSSWGNTRIEAWSSWSALDRCGPPTNLTVASSVPLSSAGQRASSEDPDPYTATVVFNGMIGPLLRMRLAAVVWYQGENNADDPSNLACRFSALVEDWRLQFDAANLHFFFVLLAGYKEGGFPTWPLARDAQLAATSLPVPPIPTSAVDLGDEFGPDGPIHPRNKSELGRRLALHALHDIYGLDVVHVGPQVWDIHWPLPGTPVQTVILRFHPGLTNNHGLQLLDTKSVRPSLLLEPGWQCLYNDHQ